MNASPRPRSPRAISLLTVAECAGVPATPGGSRGLIDPLVAVTGVCLDSRAIIPGDLYAALPGANVHGASFVAKAVELGAVAVLTDQPGASLLALSELPVPVLVVPDPRARLGQVAALVYGYASRELTMLGVTGTNGKTTTAYLLDSALRVMGHVTGLIGTIETRIGEQRIKSVRTTPESADLHALFAVMLEDGVDTCTMEVSSHALALHRVDGVRFDVAAFTNLSQDHLDFHGSMEEYYLAKASLFTAERAVQAVVCVDDEWGQRLARESQIPVVSVSSREGGPKADWQIHADGPGAFDFELIGHDAELSLRSALPGDFNRVNTAVAALVLLAAGYTSASIERALVADPQVPGRMERVILDDVLALEGADPGSMPLAVVDFAHTPDAVTAALSALRHNTSGSLIVVIGAGGDRDPGKRTAMGAAAASRADLVFVTDDNPRSEDPATIRAALMRGALAQDQTTARPAPGRIRDVGDRGTAIRAAVAIAGRGDAVVILGKGHESGQEIAGVVHPFDDRAELRAALIERAASSGPRAFRDPVGNRRGPAPADVTRGEAR